MPTEEIQGAVETTKLNEVFEQYLATIQMFDPERATSLGLHGSDFTLTQRTQERHDKELVAFGKLRDKLREIKKDSMYPAARVDYNLLDRMLEVDIYEGENLGVMKLRPQSYLEPLFSVYSMMGKDFDAYNTRAANAISRLKQFPLILEQAQRNLSRPPKIWTEHAIKETEVSIAGISDFMPIFRGYTRYDPVLKAQVDDTLEKVKTALERYRDFLQKDILPVSDGDFRAGDLTYGFYLERWYALDTTASSAYRYAKGAFKQSMKDLEKEAENIDSILAHEKGWKGVLEKLPKDHPPEDAVLKVFQDEMDRAYQHFDEYKVVAFPKQRLLIERMPAFAASVFPYVYYSGPFSLDSSRVSELFVSLPPEKLSEPAREKILQDGFNYAQMELLSAYAIMPGLHLLSFEANSNPSRIRKISSQPMTENGWACYAELLADEMGYYSSYWSHFLRVYVRALRAARAYCDASLHLKKMTETEAIDFFKDKLYFSDAQARGEVLRISLSPTQALSFVMGMDRILKMRKYYQRTEQKYFDLRKFHTAFLKEGEIPIDDLEAELRRQKSDEDNPVK
ncbi:MAG: DUF885 domain-containing protein [Elusimicrobia bacterium]|nr:DUF885 domain-containing protein [Elusimicrobiota bacterium]